MHGLIRHTPFYFNPRSPRGERPYGDLILFALFQFQSTLPARGATIETEKYFESLPISIHAPREGSDTEAVTVADFEI